MAYLTLARTMSWLPSPSSGCFRPCWVMLYLTMSACTAGRFSAAALIGLVIPATQEVDGEINAGLLRHAAKMSPDQWCHAHLALFPHDSTRSINLDNAPVGD